MALDDERYPAARFLVRENFDRARETLAKRNMKFAPDPAEDELDLHMQEAREGSSGGYGSSGGGCGCN